MTIESDDFANSTQLEENETEVIHKLLDAAKAYNWQKVLEILGEHPGLINATRPDGKSLYTPLHQAAHGNAPPEVIQQMLDMGASLTLMNAKNERASDIAKRKGYQHLIQVLTPHPQVLGDTSLLYFPSDVTEAQSICALRFQGYKYEQSLGSPAPGGTGQGLANLIAPVVNELTLHSSNDDNFAAFFGLQRSFKWGGEYLTKYSEEHVAYDFLFLHLYAHEPRGPFRHDDYCRQWQSSFLPKVERIAAVVRKSFRRIGEGNKIAMNSL